VGGDFLYPGLRRAGRIPAGRTAHRRDSEYSFETKLAYGLTLRTLAHRHGLHFYAADNDMRLLGDSPHCCGSEWVMKDGPRHSRAYHRAGVPVAARFWRAQMLPADDARMQVSLNFLNWGTAAGRRMPARCMTTGCTAIYGQVQCAGWVRRIMPQAQVIGPDANGDMHYRIDPHF